MRFLGLDQCVKYFSRQKQLITTRVVVLHNSNPPEHSIDYTCNNTPGCNKIIRT